MIRNLKTQFDIIFEIIETYKPELCLQLLTIGRNDADLKEFHHILDSLPFFNILFKIKSFNFFLKKEDVFCKVVDNSLLNNIELFQIETFSISQTLFKKPIIKKNIIHLCEDDFAHIFKDIISGIESELTLPEIETEWYYKQFSF